MHLIQRRLRQIKMPPTPVMRRMRPSARSLRMLR
jgi:hypothetical protein